MATAVAILGSEKLIANQSDLKDVPLYSDDTKDNLGSLLVRPDIDAVIIALPILVQPEIIKRALSSGKHVLSEKPIAKDVATAKELISWHQTLNNGTTWSVAENFRSLTRFRSAAAEVQKLGRVLGFRLRLTTMNNPGGKYIETAWRKTPEYQGGFLLDGGVHFVAGIRLCLGDEAKLTKVAAFATQLQKHLPPVDTVDGVARLANGASGTISISFGTTFTGAEWTVACEKGTVEVDRDRVTVVSNGQKTDHPMPQEGSGVGPEVKAWAESVGAGKVDELLTPQEALSDLEVIQALLESSEQDGAPIDLKLQ